jgi:hypothetical protein
MRRDTTRAVAKFARLQWPGVVVGVLLIIPTIVVSQWVPWVLLLPIVCVLAFLAFWWGAKVRQSRRSRPGE